MKDVQAVPRLLDLSELAEVLGRSPETIKKDIKRVRADPNLSHRADPILSQGWKPTF